MGALFLILGLFGITLPLLQAVKAHFTALPAGLMRKLYWYHILFAAIYYIYVQSSASDSVAYYERSQTEYESWAAAYGTGTPFIDFLAWPFINYLGFSYEMMMVLFAWLGYWGFVFFYIVFRENIRFKHSLQGIDLVSLIIFLPNMHYWTASLGKGSVIFLALGMAMYGLSRLKSRKIALLIGLLIIYHVRPHVFFLMGLGILAGLITARARVPWYQKLLVFAGVGVAVFFLYDDVMAFANLDSENLLESFDQLAAQRSVELAKAGSGIDISGYPLPLKLFTFWFRPLFVDAPGPIGFIVSFENLFYLWMAAGVFNGNFTGFMRKSPALVKTSAVVFLATSFALSGALSNLGIIIRQKSMVMYFFLFILLAFMDYKKGIVVNKKKKAMERRLSQAPAL
ncbi:hypothetical protein HB364_20085 [Pseudoflavitalea sp. X16]|uniref:hypothetical protein n=1 Tax=Paraflavitalea devenefica TaxID=2716334 RepID=UPI00141E6C84|nr:hypothetical protein [Paraflavitalea devenefica]NII27400.1 hypothetical protein [Paraflavitalea devenefica]